MTDTNTHLVAFDKWCPKCVHHDKSGYEEPCDDCLGCPVMENSTKPLKFKKKED